MLTLAQQGLLFQDAPDVPLWIGIPQALSARIEAVPFKYDALKYVMVFMHPVEYLGNEADIPAYSQAWASGYMPQQTVRLVKFFQFFVCLKSASVHYRRLKVFTNPEIQLQG